MPEFFRAVGAARFGVMAGVAAVLTAFFLYVAGAITTPPKTILYAGLEPRDAAAVTAKLDAMNVKYDMQSGGGTILVPADQVTRLRMALAQDNLPSAGVGYEIFDKTDTFGTTAFVQNINRLRALEGELARSIQTIDGIEGARVHLVIPQREIFSRDNQTPSASVVLRAENPIGRGEVAAIQHLVAAAVAGLSPQRVAIVDDHGTLLAGGEERTGPNAAAADQDQQTTDYENHLRQKIESILASVVGPGHVRVEVAADINYTHKNITEEKFDPDSKVARSTQTIQQDSTDSNGAAPVSVGSALPAAAQAGAGAGGDTGRSTSGHDEETINYEINKTTTNSVVEGGDVARLSVAVVVDGTDVNGHYKPRSAADMAKITSLVKSAMGFQKTRGDQVQVTNMAFARVDVQDATPAPQPFLGLNAAYWFKIIEAAILSLTALLIGLFVVRPLIQRMFAPMAPAPAALPATPVAGALPPPAPNAQTAPALSPPAQAAAQLAPPAKSPIDVSRIEGEVRESAIRKVGEVVDAHPEEALAIIRTWLHQPA